MKLLDIVLFIIFLVATGCYAFCWIKIPEQRWSKLGWGLWLLNVDLFLAAHVFLGKTGIAWMYAILFHAALTIVSRAIFTLNEVNNEFRVIKSIRRFSDDITGYNTRNSGIG